MLTDSNKESNGHNAAGGRGSSLFDEGAADSDSDEGGPVNQTMV